MDNTDLQILTNSGFTIEKLEPRYAKAVQNEYCITIAFTEDEGWLFVGYKNDNHVYDVSYSSDSDDETECFEECLNDVFDALGFN